MHFCLVILDTNGVHERSHLFHGYGYDKVTEQANKEFARLVRSKSEKPITDEEMEDLLDEGFFQLPNGYVALTWPTSTDADRYTFNGQDGCMANSKR